MAQREGETEKLGFEVFDLSVTLGPHFVPWISATSRLGHVHGIPRLDPEVPPLSDLLDSVYDFVDSVQFAERDALPDLKRALRQLAFGEPTVMELFQATRGVAAEHGRELLVRILASPHLAALPWELLPDPGKSHSEGEEASLALAPDASVVRLARGRTYPIRTDRLEPPLNLLVVLSSPVGRDPADDSLAFDIYEERRALLAELKPLVDAGLLRVDVEDKPTLQNLRRRIGAQRRGYHLFHYLGHAEPDKLILEDDAGRREDQSASRFMEILRLCPDLRLAVFAGCETARASGDPLTVDAAATDGWRHILSLADRCVQESCPVVVGMQAVLSFRTERLFTRFFYQGLASGYSVTGAMRLARGATRGDRHIGGDLLDWSVPVLFVGGAEPGPLLDRSTRGVPPTRTARYVLRLGLRQRETRFFARDVALRQAIDILSGEAPERVLVLTGPPAVGKTMLIDRAIDEIAGPVSILYVRLEDLASELDATSGSPPSAGISRPESWVTKLAKMETEACLEKLCGLVAELLTREDGRRHDSEPGQTPSDWWLRLIEELASQRFVLVIDNVETLVRREESLTKSLVEYWLKRQVEQARSAAGPLRDLLEKFIEHLRRGGGLNQMPGVPTNPFVSGLSELEGWLAGWTNTARDSVTAEAENWLSHLELRTEAESANTKQQERERDQEGLREAARRLASMRQGLDKALRMIAERRLGARLAVVADKLPDRFLDPRSESDQRFVMRLGHLTWFETWRWIRRNLPGLLRYGDEYLERMWPRLGADLELWEELERRILALGTVEPQIPKIVDEIAPRRISTRNRLPGIDPPRGERPLRVAVAGPHIKSASDLALAVTRLAAIHGIGGHAVASDEDAKGSLAVLVEVPSPFRNEPNAPESVIIDFLRELFDRKPDIVLLDYGQMVRLPLPDATTHQRSLLETLRHQALLIAAGGNRGAETDAEFATAPGVYPGVLSVGSIDGGGHLQPYTEWIPKLSKPDIFMPDQLVGTPLEGALNDDALRAVGGSSFAALHAVGAAILVWSTLPDLTPYELRELLRRASQPVDTASEPRPLMLTVQAAVSEARMEAVRRSLREGPCSLQALAAITGLDLRVANNSLDRLFRKGEIRRLARGRLERYELRQE
jgi:hypothetical protein